MNNKVISSKRPDRRKPWEVRWRDANGKPHSKFFKTRELRDSFADELDKKVSTDGNAVFSIDMDENPSVGPRLPVPRNVQTLKLVHSPSHSLRLVVCCLDETVPRIRAEAIGSAFGRFS